MTKFTEWADDFPWEWYLTHLGLSARRGEQKRDVPILEEHDLVGALRPVEIIVEARSETGLNLFSESEAEHVHATALWL